MSLGRTNRATEERLERQVGAMVVGLDDNQGDCTPSLSSQGAGRLMNRKCRGQAGLQEVP